MKATYTLSSFTIVTVLSKPAIHTQPYHHAYRHDAVVSISLSHALHYRQVYSFALLSYKDCLCIVYACYHRITNIINNNVGVSRCSTDY